MQWIISDCHGCCHTLEKLLWKIRGQDPSPLFVFVGDYVDRGLFNKEVVELAVQLQKEGAVCLRGNHDDVVDWLLNKHCLGNSKEWVVGELTEDKVVNWWMLNGLKTTFQSYNATNLEEFKANVPDSHKEFFRNLPLFWESDTHFACHAFMRPNEPLPRSMKFVQSDRNEEILWSRFSYGDAVYKKNLAEQWDKIGVFGHTPVSTYIPSKATPIKSGKVRLIDTGVFIGEAMSAYNCNTDSFISETTDRRDIFK